MICQTFIQNQKSCHTDFVKRFPLAAEDLLHSLDVIGESWTTQGRMTYVIKTSPNQIHSLTLASLVWIRKSSDIPFRAHIVLSVSWIAIGNSVANQLIVIDATILSIGRWTIVKVFIKWPASVLEFDSIVLVEKTTCQILRYKYRIYIKRTQIFNKILWSWRKILNVVGDTPILFESTQVNRWNDGNLQYSRKINKKIHLSLRLVLKKSTFHHS